MRSLGETRHAVGGWAAPLGIELRVDGFAAVMLVTVAIVGLFVGLATFVDPPRTRSSSPPIAGLARVDATRAERLRIRLEGASEAREFFTSWLFGCAALAALVVSGDAFNLYVALELLTLASVGLIALEGGEATASGLDYLVLSFLASLGYLGGVALLYGMTGTLDMRLLGERLTVGPVSALAVAFVLGSLGLKAALYPLQAWLPPVYARSTPPASALLSGLVSKGAFFVVLRFAIGIPAVFGSVSLSVLGAQGALSIVWGSLLALRQDRLRSLLAFSSVSHGGYLFLALPLGTTQALGAAILMAVSHALASSAMFLAVSTVERSMGDDEIESFEGVAHRHPFAFLALALGGISLIGVPPSIGFVAKWLFVRAAIEDGQWWWALIVVVGGLLAAAYVFRILRRAFEPARSTPPIDRMPSASELAGAGLALLSLLLGVFPSGLSALLVEGAS